MIYLNHAATSYPKDKAVLEAFYKAASDIPSGQYRSGAGMEEADIFAYTKEGLGKLLGIQDTESIHFTSGATEGLNAIFCGMGICADHIVTTAAEHNSVLRPLYNLPEISGEPIIVATDKEGYVSPRAIENALTSDTRALVVNHCSNVTGAIQNLEEIGRLCKNRNLIFVVDASQSAGALPIKTDEWGIDALAFTGHKSLGGLQGTGGYYAGKYLNLKPLKYGGTGLDSRRIRYDNIYEYEVGTQNGPGISSLGAAVDSILEIGIDHIHYRENVLRKYLINELENIKGIKIYGAGLYDAGPCVSFNMAGMKPGDISYILQNSYGIITRAGLMCTPLIHECIKSGPDGLVRISFSHKTTEAELDALTGALKEISEVI